MIPTKLTGMSAGIQSNSRSLSDFVVIKSDSLSCVFFTGMFFNLNFKSSAVNESIDR